MTEPLPLLVFPQYKRVDPTPGRGFGASQPHMPSHTRQVDRLNLQIATFQQDFERYKASISESVAGLEPETVLVIEIAGAVDDFKQAVEAVGLEWLGEWDLDDIEPSDDFYEEPKIGADFFKNHLDEIANRNQSKEIRDALLEQGVIDQEGKLIVEVLSDITLPEVYSHLVEEITTAIEQAKQKKLAGRLFVTMGNEAGMQELLSLWQQWQNRQTLPQGKTKWRDVFNQTLLIRRWGVEETLDETGMLDRWRNLLEPIYPTESVHCQIELFYRQSADKRRQNEDSVRTLIEQVGGSLLSGFLDMPDIAFHAVKAKLPADQIRQLLADLESEQHDTDIQLFKFHGIMYFRPTGQSLTTTADGEGEDAVFPPSDAVLLPPVAAILDGAPNLEHEALKGRLLIDDPENIEAQYQPGQKRHGTAMASLVVHGELDDEEAEPLHSAVYIRPIMQPDPQTANGDEHIPDDAFFEDRIERAVRRMREGEGGVEPQAEGIRVINLSIGDPARPFIHTPSPWARLLDWLSWKYRVLFCVSAGNYAENLDIAISHRDYLGLSDEEKTELLLKRLQAQLSERRILSPAESINALSIGAIHKDSAGNYYQGQRTDLLPYDSLPSPASRLGLGFRRSLKPEILFPGGRQLYRTPVLDSQTEFSIDKSLVAPGQKVAWDSNQQGELSKTAYIRGSSNAAALATRSAVRIYEMLNTLRTEESEDIPEELMAVLMKTLLVHGAKQDEAADTAITSALKTEENGRRFKEIKSRYLGYGAVDIERVLACTAQRGTVLGCGEIKEDEVHEYRFPLPPGLAGKTDWRRMVVTLAWFTPINPLHRHLREAKLELAPGKKWEELPLKLVRKDSDHNQVMRGTVQHEVVEGAKQITDYQDGVDIVLQVRCKKDATAKLDHDIPYGLAVTLEVEEGVGIPVYEQLRQKLKPKVAVGATGDRR